MKIRFETTIKDVIAFNRFHFANSPAWRRQVWVQTLLGPIIFGVGWLVVHFVLADALRHPEAVLEFTGLDVILGLSFLACSIGWGFMYPDYMNRLLEKNTHKFLAEGSNLATFGWREMELVNHRLILNTELIQSSVDLRAFEKIVSNDEYTFVYIASTSAYMIPMKLYPEEEYRLFVAELLDAWDNRDAPRPAPQPAEEYIVAGPV